jgi:hypothetical protein
MLSRTLVAIKGDIPEAAYAEELKDGSLQHGEQEGIPVSENPSGVMSCDHQGSPMVTRGDRIEEHIKANHDGSLRY